MYSRVVKLRDQAVVKFSAYLIEDEVSNQRRAYQITQPLNSSGATCLSLFHRQA